LGANAITTSLTGSLSNGSILTGSLWRIKGIPNYNLINYPNGQTPSTYDRYPLSFEWIEEVKFMYSMRQSLYLAATNGQLKNIAIGYYGKNSIISWSWLNAATQDQKNATTGSAIYYETAYNIKSLSSFIEILRGFRFIYNLKNIGTTNNP